MVNNLSYYTAESGNRQDKANPVFWLLVVIFGHNNKCIIDHACLVKMAGYRPHSFFVVLLIHMVLDWKKQKT